MSPASTQVVAALVVAGLCLVSLDALPANGLRTGSDRRDIAVASVPDSVLAHAITVAAAYLEKACDSDGRFTYQVNVKTGRDDGTYNVLRHAGAIYALAVLNDARPDPRAADAISRAARMLQRDYVARGIRRGLAIVWSEPAPRHRDAELGATGLGLVALAAARRVDPTSVSLARMQALGRFLLFLQRADGSFVSKYRATSGPVTRFTSLYYPGEAALGLLSLYETDHSRVWLEAAGKALLFLARTRAGFTIVPPDHWALIATARLFKDCQVVVCPVSRDELIAHAIHICRSILASQVHAHSPNALDGAFDPTGRTAPVATRVEGLVAALKFLPRGGLYDTVAASAERGVAFLLRAQIKSGLYAGGVPGAVLRSPSDRVTIRIDYVQHMLCAWLGYQVLRGGQ